MAPSRIPRPGSPVRGSTTGRPVMAALDLLGRRWSLRLLWELRRGPVGARALLERCSGLSSSVLYERLRELTAAGLVEKDDDSAYRLTDLGHDLGAALEPLDAWARRWAGRTDR
jgi:DNA-binding HxlR family transcriptional regulator